MTDTIDYIDNYFKSITIPNEPIPIGKGVTIINPQLFIEASLSQLRNYAACENKNYLIFPCILRLKLFKYELGKRGIVPADDGQTSVVRNVEED